MPNVTTRNQAPASTPTSRRLPSWLERALADALSLEHPDVTWTAPPVPVFVSDPKRELRAAIEILAPAPVTPKHAVWCLGKLMLAFGTKLDAEATKLQGAVWIEACGDLGDELWSKATMALIRGWRRDDHYGRLPEPADFREAVVTDLAERTKKITRCKAMLEAHGGGEPAKPGPFVPEPLDVRLRTMRDGFRRVGQDWKAAKYERQLAEHEGRAVEDWANEAPIPDATKGEKVNIPLPPPSDAMRANLLATSAKNHRARGRHELADDLDRQADELGYQRPMFEPVDEAAA